MQTLEQKLTRLKEIQTLLMESKANLTGSMELLEEAMNLKKEIDGELSVLENKLIQLTAQSSQTEL